MKAPQAPTVAEVRALLEQAERDHLAAAAALGEALIVQQALPSRDVSFEQGAVEAARLRVEALKVMLPLVEKAEADALAEVRAKLANEQHKRQERALNDLIKQALHFSVSYQNAASAFRRMVKAGDEASNLLSEKQKVVGNGTLAARLHPQALKALGDQELNRVGLLPAHVESVSAPGTNRATVELRFTNAPDQLPALEGEVRRLMSSLLAIAPTPLPTPEEPTP